jgi:hypothetical protein
MATLASPVMAPMNGGPVLPEEPTCEQPGQPTVTEFD